MKSKKIKILHQKIKNRYTSNLEYFFYAYDPVCAESLTQELLSLGYSAEINDISDLHLMFIINGFTSYSDSIAEDLSNWFTRMENLAKKHQCEFDGWERPLD